MLKILAGWFTHSHTVAKGKGRISEDHTNALRAFKQLDDHRRTANKLENLIGALRVIGKGSGR